MDKYSIMQNVTIQSKNGTAVYAIGNEFICICTGPNKDTNAERIKNLLNETSRSQGKWPQK